MSVCDLLNIPELTSVHVMDQLRHLLYHTPVVPLPWDPTRVDASSLSHDPNGNTSSKTNSRPVTPELGALSSKAFTEIVHPIPRTPDSARSSPRSEQSGGAMSPAQKFIASEIKCSPERGHPNIAKLLDFFEDREFYYCMLFRSCDAQLISSGDASLWHRSRSL